MRKAALGLLFVGLLGCRPEPPRTETGAPIAALALREVDWNPTRAPLVDVRAVADDGPVVTVVTSHGATVLADGAVSFHDERKPWAAAAVVPGADGARRWIVLLDRDGHVAYLKNKSAFEDVSPRYGLEGVAVRRATPVGATTVAFQLDHGIAVADGTKVARYASPAYAALEGGGGAIAGTLEDRIEVVRQPEGSATSYPIRHVVATAVGRDGTLYAATRDGLYATDAVRSLSRVFSDPGGRIHGLVVSGSRVWFADGDALGVIDGGRVMLAEAAHIGSHAELVPSPDGDVWVIDQGTLRRFQPLIAAPSPDSALLSAVFARSCVRCHAPGGEAGIDLSTAAAWDAHKAAIRKRVVLTRSMPPGGAPSISDGDREAVKRWAESP